MNAKDVRVRNYGLCLLRMFMCFEVICNHFWVVNTHVILSPFILLRKYAVPVFMFMSFLLAKPFSEITLEKMKSRMQRLLIPLWGWALLYFLVYTILGINGMDIITSIKGLFWQILTGHVGGYNSAMWYQSVLAALTFLLFLIFYRLNRNKAVVVSVGVLFISLILQYSGVNHVIFSSLRFEVRYPLGRFVEMIPCAVLGILIVELDLLSKLRKHRIVSILSCFVVCCSAICLDRILPEVPGFSYSGLPTLCVGITMALFAFLLPLERLPDVWKRAVDRLSQYTLGIYAMHLMVGTLLTRLLGYLNIHADGFLFCIVIYVISYIVSDAITKLPWKKLCMLVQ